MTIPYDHVIDLAQLADAALPGARCAYKVEAAYFRSAAAVASQQVNYDFAASLLRDTIRYSLQDRTDPESIELRARFRMLEAVERREQIREEHAYGFDGREAEEDV